MRGSGRRVTIAVFVATKSGRHVGNLISLLYNLELPGISAA